MGMIVGPDNDDLTVWAGVFSFSGEYILQAFCEAAERDDLDTIVSFIEQGARLDEMVLIAAARGGSLRVLDWLLSLDRREDWDGGWWSDRGLEEAESQAVDGDEDEHRQAVEMLQAARAEAARVELAMAAGMTPEEHADAREKIRKPSTENGEIM